MDLKNCRSILQSAGVTLARGLSAVEASEAEQRFGFVFPEDLRELLRCFLPVGEDFPNWRNPDDPSLLDMMARPLEGVWHTVRYPFENAGGRWNLSWGPHPADLEQATRRMRAVLAQAPKLIQIYAHRYMPDQPSTSGNPVFSIVYPTDIICYAANLEDYLMKEFVEQTSDDAVASRGRARLIDFWSSLVDRNVGTDGDYQWQPKPPWGSGLGSR
uniref:SMI1/KNR4 family protein n=1 Tax=unclassified Variovorax TaxID=663243 RepID=UPI00104951F5